VEKRSAGQALHVASLVAVHAVGSWPGPQAAVSHAWQSEPSVEKVTPSAQALHTVSLVVVHSPVFPVPGPHVLHERQAFPSLE
jgi:hypothetical protein